MATGYTTLRIKSGLYLSTDNNFKIERKPQYFPGRRRWSVYRYMDGNWKEMQTFESLAEARKYVGENVNGWWS